MKNCFCKITTIVCQLAWLSLTAVGAQQGDFVYNANGSGGAVVEGYVGPGGALVIPGTRGGLPVVGIAADTFQLNQA